jgi:predicted lipoprotein with Yx(FWY)xxD motif
MQPWCSVVPRLRPAALALLGTVVLLLAGCGSGGDEASSAAVGSGDGTTSTSSPPSETSATATIGARSGLVLTTRNSDYGTVLCDGRHQAVYLVGKESTDRAECYGACAEAWPPVLTDGAARASGGARADLLGTTERRDGTTQVTYDGHPLNYYVHDGAGQILCHNVNEFGGLWLVVTPRGTPAA